MTQPCSAQKRCSSNMSDWKLNTGLLRLRLLPRPRTIGSAATWRCRRDIGAADTASRQIFSVNGWAAGRRAALRDRAHRPVQPAIANPHQSDDQDEQDKFWNREHMPDLRIARKLGQETLRSREQPQSPNLAHKSRASIQSAKPATVDRGSRPTKGSRLTNGQRRLSAETGRSFTLSP